MQRRILLALTLLFFAHHAWADANQQPEALLAAGQYQQALAQLDLELKNNPADPKALFLRAVTLEKLGQVEAAAELYQQLIKDQPQLPEPYNNLAVIYARQGKYPQAEQTLQAAIKTHPSYAAAHSNLSEIYKTLASIAYNKALNPNNGQPPPDRANLQAIESLRSYTPPGASEPAQGVQPALPVASRPETVTAPPAAPDIASASKNDSKPAQMVDIKAVEQSVMDWSRAWSAQDVAAYLRAYSASFQPPEGLTRAAWEAQRKERLQAPKYIRVELGPLQTTVLNNDYASVIFRQRYQSNRLKATTTKLLILTYENEQWRILQETEIN